MDLPAFKVVYKFTNAPKGEYVSAIERSETAMVTYKMGKEASPRVGENQFLFIFDTYKHAREFRREFFGGRSRGLAQPTAILEVAAKNVTKQRTTLGGHVFKGEKVAPGTLFCSSCVPIKRVD